MKGPSSPFCGVEISQGKVGGVDTTAILVKSSIGILLMQFFPLKVSTSHLDQL